MFLQPKRVHFTDWSKTVRSALLSDPAQALKTLLSMVRSSQPLTRAILAIASTPEYREKLAPFNVFPKPTGPQELMAILQAENRQFAGLVKASGYVPE